MDIQYKAPKMPIDVIVHEKLKALSKTDFDKCL